MIARLKMWAIAAGAALLAILGIYRKGRADQRHKEQVETLRRRTQAMKEKHDVEDEITRLPDADVRSGLDRWVRKNNG